MLDQFFGAAVKQADMRVDPLDHFAVKFEHKAKHAMRGRMLRPEIDGEGALDIARRGVGFQHHANSFTFAAFAATRALNLSHGDDEALMPALADQIDAVMRPDLERHARPGDFDAFDVDRHRHARAASPRGG